MACVCIDKTRFHLMYWEMVIAMLLDSVDSRIAIFRQIQDLELIALCQQYNVPAGSNIIKEKFQCMAVDGLFMVIQDELCSGDIVKSVGMTRCAQVCKLVTIDLHVHISDTTLFFF